MGGQPDPERTFDDGTGSAASDYAYDFENRLIELDKTTTDSSASTGTFSYAYDYRTRRVSRDEEIVGSGTTSTNVIFSGGTSVEEFTTPTAGSPIVRFVRGSGWGGGVGEPALLSAGKGLPRQPSSTTTAAATW